MTRIDATRTDVTRIDATRIDATRVYATRILCVWLPNWPIQRLVVQRPELRRQQVLLFRRDSRRGQLVNAASPLARQAGCCVGMPLSEAKSLLRRSQSQETFLFEHDLKQDLQAIEQLCQSLESFSPTVGLESIDELDFKRGKRPAALLLDVTGLAHLFGDENSPRLPADEALGIRWILGPSGDREHGWSGVGGGSFFVQPLLSRTATATGNRCR